VVVEGATAPVVPVTVVGACRVVVGAVVEVAGGAVPPLGRCFGRRGTAVVAVPGALVVVLVGAVLGVVVLTGTFGAGGIVVSRAVPSADRRCLRLTVAV
jgi:hypothetical protein